MLRKNSGRRKSIDYQDINRRHDEYHAYENLCHSLFQQKLLLDYDFGSLPKLAQLLLVSDSLTDFEVLLMHDECIYL